MFLEILWQGVSVVWGCEAFRVNRQAMPANHWSSHTHRHTACTHTRKV